MITRITTTPTERRTEDDNTHDDNDDDFMTFQPDSSSSMFFKKNFFHKINTQWSLLALEIRNTSYTSNTGALGLVLFQILTSLTTFFQNTCLEDIFA